MTVKSIKVFLTPKEKSSFQSRPCNLCKHLKQDEYAIYGYCNKLTMWNPTGLNGCSF